MLPRNILPTTACQELYILSNNYRVLYECIVNKEGPVFQIVKPMKLQMVYLHIGDTTEQKRQVKFQYNFTTQVLNCTVCKCHVHMAANSIFLGFDRYLGVALDLYIRTCKLLLSEYLEYVFTKAFKNRLERKPNYAAFKCSDLSSYEGQSFQPAYSSLNSADCYPKRKFRKIQNCTKQQRVKAEGDAKWTAYFKILHGKPVSLLSLLQELLLFLLHYVVMKKTWEAKYSIYTWKERACVKGVFAGVYSVDILHGNFLIPREMEYLLCFIPIMLMPGPWTARNENAQGKAQQLQLQKHLPCQHSS